MSLGVDGTSAPDPFTEGGTPQSQSIPPQQPTHPAQLPTGQPDVNGFQTFSSAYNHAGATAAPQGYMYNYNYATPTGYSPYGQMGATQATYPSAYGYNSSPYPGHHAGYGPMPAPARMSALTHMQQSGAQVLNTMQDAMTRFARVSAQIDDVLRHVHMLFDAVFGLGYSVGAVRAETRLWLATKTGPVAFIARIARTVANVWRVLTLFLVSPMAGRYSPVAFVLKLLGLVPPEAVPNQVAYADLWAGAVEREEAGGADEEAGTQKRDDSSAAEVADVGVEGERRPEGGGEIQAPANWQNL